MRVLIGLLLSLCLAATSLTMAVTRGQARIGGVVVLCTGSGPLALAVDDKGNPLQSRHICPDCALSLFAAQAVLPVPVLAPSGWRSLRLAPARAAAPHPRLPQGAQARGPPVPV